MARYQLLNNNNNNNNNNNIIIIIIRNKLKPGMHHDTFQTFHQNYN